MSLVAWDGLLGIRCMLRWSTYRMVLMGGGVLEAILFMISMKRVPLRGGALWNPAFLGVSKTVMATYADLERAIFEEAVQEWGKGTLQPS